MVGNNSSGLSKQPSDSDSCCGGGEKSMSGRTDMTNRALPYGTTSQLHKIFRHRCVWYGGLISSSLFFPSLLSILT